MFDGDVDSQDEFETSVTTSIQKALSALWCSYNFPFRVRNIRFKTRVGREDYNAPDGNIIQKNVQGKTVYGLRIGKKFLNYEPDYEILEEKTGEPESFFVKNERIYLYPTPNNIYNVDAEYLTIYPACDELGNSKATLEVDTDYIDIPERYEILFENALITLTMVYAIASESDENYAGYLKQYNDAYKLLIEFTKGIELDRRIGWR